MPFDSLLEIKREPVEKVLGALKSSNIAESREAGTRLLREANRVKLSVRDYLLLSIDPNKGDHADDYRNAGVNGYQAALHYLGLPIKDDFAQGVTLQAASETFQTYPGTRALFPPVIDDMLYWNYRQTGYEQLEPMLALSRTVDGPEVLFTIVDDKAEDYESAVVSELGRIPVASIRTSENTVRFFKHGSGIRTSYEFNRRMRLDLLTPFAARIARGLVLSKVKAATAVLVGGDLAGTAAGVIAQSSYNTQVGTNSTNGQLSYLHLLAWLVARAQAGVPVDTVVGNWDAMFQWMRLFAPTLTGDRSAVDATQAMSGMRFTIPTPFPQIINFAVSSTAPANRLIGFSKADTLEELRETGSDIAEEERAILNQSITYVRTENVGFRLLYKDTRSVFNFGA